MPRAGYGDLEVGSETSAPQAVHPVGSAAAPGIAFSTDTDLGLYRHAANEPDYSNPNYRSNRLV